MTTTKIVLYDTFGCPLIADPSKLPYYVDVHDEAIYARMRDFIFNMTKNDTVNSYKHSSPWYGFFRIRCANEDDAVMIKLVT